MTIASGNKDDNAIRSKRIDCSICVRCREVGTELGILFASRVLEGDTKGAVVGAAEGDTEGAVVGAAEGDTEGAVVGAAVTVFTKISEVVP